jgi:hypothetical protein
MRTKRYYGQAVSQVGEFLKDATGLMGDATRAMVEDRPGDAVSCLHQAKNMLEGAIVSAQWAERLTAGDRE